MNVHPTAIEGVLIIEPRTYRDHRGFFRETYHQPRYAEAGVTCAFVQDNHSASVRGVLRGIHLQGPSAPMAKLVRCVAGEVLDVVVDLRFGAPTFGRSIAVTLSADNARQVFIPVGCGHAFYTCSDWAEIEYKCSGLYSPAAELTIAWDDPTLAIGWPTRAPIVSDKDAQGMSLAKYAANPAYTYVG